MAVTEYYTVNGQIIGEQVHGGARVRYMPDALGSVTVANNGTKDNPASYTPYGRGDAPSGATMGWAGAQGYRGNTHGIYYVRARHYTAGRWLSADLLWPVESAYNYCDSNPTSTTDATGLKCASKFCDPIATATPNGDNPCIVEKVKSGPQKGKWKVRVYKCFKVVCSTSGNGDYTCTLTQWKSGKITSHGKVIDNPHHEKDFEREVPCPGSYYEYDGPGLSDYKSSAQDPCSKQPSLYFSQADLWPQLDYKFERYFVDECRCGNKTSTAKWSVGFTIKLVNGAPKCSFLKL